MKINMSFPLAIAAFTISTLTSQAATIVAYDFATNASPTPGSEIANTTSTPVTSTAAQWTGSSNNGWSSSSQSYFGRGPSNTAGTSYIGFTVTADPTYTLDLTALSFNYHMSQIQSAGGGAFTFEIKSSLDSYAAAIPGTYSKNPVTAGTAIPAGESASFDLSGGSYDDLANITFRLYVTGSVTGNTNDIARWDNILVEGSVNSIPEPSTALLGSLGLLALLRRRR